MLPKLLQRSVAEGGSVAAVSSVNQATLAAFTEHPQFPFAIVHQHFVQAVRALAAPQLHRTQQQHHTHHSVHPFQQLLQPPVPVPTAPAAAAGGPRPRVVLPMVRALDIAAAGLARAMAAQPAAAQLLFQAQLYLLLSDTLAELPDPHADESSKPPPPATAPGPAGSAAAAAAAAAGAATGGDGAAILDVEVVHMTRGPKARSLNVRRRAAKEVDKVGAVL